MGGLIIDYDGTIIDLTDQSQVVKLNTDSLNTHHVIAPICVVSSQLLTVWLFDTPAFAINCCSIESLVPLWSRVVRFFFLSITSSSSFTERLSPHIEDRLVLDALSMLHDVPLWMIQCEESYFPNCPCRTYCKQHVCLFKFASIGASSANRRKSTLFGRFL